ncbi:unnamed protein product [Ambrosiozyma monospora]|uniref:Unnamed protein product n=1 Tax=Ambrosiozyma monospora TaxID=43982 RepID=A0ACB5TAW5_AMBMO|nr:unnamed protein product [Ambrosiozyma monospora]
MDKEGNEVSISGSLQCFSNITASLPSNIQKTILELSVNYLHPLDADMELTILILNHISISRLKITVDNEHSWLKTEYIGSFRVPHGLLYQYLQMFDHCPVVTVHLDSSSQFLKLSFLKPLLIRCDFVIITQVFYLRDERVWFCPAKVIEIHDINQSATEKLTDCIQCFPSLITITVTKATHDILKTLTYLTSALDTINVYLQDNVSDVMKTVAANTNPKIKIHLHKVNVYHNDLVPVKMNFLSQNKIGTINQYAESNAQPVLCPVHQNTERLYYNVGKLTGAILKNNTLQQFAIFPLKVLAFVTNCNFHGLKNITNFQIWGTLDYASFRTLPSQIEEMDLSMPPNVKPNMKLPDKPLSYGLRSLPLGNQKQNKFQLPFKLKKLPLHNVNFMHLFDFKTCEKSLRFDT